MGDAFFKHLEKATSSSVDIFIPWCRGISFGPDLLPGRPPNRVGNDRPGTRTVPFFRYSFLDAIREIFFATKHYLYWSTHGSVFFTAIPALLLRVFPSQYYATLISVLLVGVGMWVTFLLSGLERKNGWIVLLAWSCSPVLLSFSLYGWGYGPQILAHALALFMVLNRKLNTSWWKTLLFGLITIEVSWHLGELAKTVYLVWVAAIISIAAIPLAVRLSWVFLSGWQIYQTRTMSSGHSNVFIDYFFKNLSVESVAKATGLFFRALFIEPELSLPTLIVLAVAGLLILRRNRIFWSLVFLLQVGVLYVGLVSQQAHGRRFIGVEFYCLAIIAVLYAELKERRPKKPAKRAKWEINLARYMELGLVPCLIAGSFLQLGSMAWEFRVPLRVNQEALPFVSTPVDCRVHQEHIDLANRLYRLVVDGHKIIPLYNFSSRYEETTDPGKILERLYLRLGHKRFVENVFVFGSSACVFNCMPFYKLYQIPFILERIASGKLGPISKFRVEGITDDEPAELKELKLALDARFTLAPETIFGRFRTRELLSAKENIPSAR